MNKALTQLIATGLFLSLLTGSACATTSQKVNTCIGTQAKSACFYIHDKDECTNQYESHGSFYVQCAAKSIQNKLIECQDTIGGIQIQCTPSKS